MKFIVDVLPKTKGECPYSKWKPYPPFIEEIGAYYCEFDKEVCNLKEDGDCSTCRWLRKVWTAKEL